MIMIAAVKVYVYIFSGGISKGSSGCSMNSYNLLFRYN